MTTTRVPTPLQMNAKRLGYSFTRHAKTQAVEKGFSLADVLKAASEPSITYGNGMAENQVRHIRDGIVVIVDEVSRSIITVYRNVVETEVRQDQVESGSVNNKSKHRLMWPCFACGHLHDPESAGSCDEAECQPECSECSE